MTTESLCHDFSRVSIAWLRPSSSVQPGLSSSPSSLRNTSEGFSAAALGSTHTARKNPSPLVVGSSSSTDRRNYTEAGLPPGPQSFVVAVVTWVSSESSSTQVKTSLKCSRGIFFLLPSFWSNHQKEFDFLNPLHLRSQVRNHLDNRVLPEPFVAAVLPGFARGWPGMSPCAAPAAPAIH